MKQLLFETPIWISQIKTKRLQLISSGFKKSFFSNIITSFEGKNVMPEGGQIYLDLKIKEILKDDFKINKIKDLSFWRNIYKNSFQDKHNHAGYNFSFIIYEQIKKPQTIFIHPANDLINSSKLNNYLKTHIKLNVKENDIIIFPSYLDHMVPLIEEAITIAGNFNIE